MIAPIQYPAVGGWRHYVRPVVEALDLTADMGMVTSYSPENSRALADLIRTMAGQIDDRSIMTMTVEQLIAGQFPPGFMKPSERKS